VMPCPTTRVSLLTKMLMVSVSMSVRS